MLTKSDSLSDWLVYMAGIHVCAIDMGLERVLPVLHALNIQKNAFVFTVAGTNGKGSTTSAIAQICQNAGLKTALYQSPHLVSFNERMRINGQIVDDKTLSHAFYVVEQARMACKLSLSFFEMTTLAALYIFAKNHCDVWVLEIGLGGRLDVVNIIEPDVCVITNIAIDHTDWLGDTRETIGFEKAGILRDNIPFVYGETDMPASVATVAHTKAVKSYQRGKDFEYRQTGDGYFIYSAKAITLALPVPSISLDNACVAVSAVLASGLAINKQAIVDGLRAVRLPGRFDVRLIKERLWVFDVAHNKAGIAFLMEQFVPFWQNNIQQGGGQLHTVFSMLADKDVDGVLSLIKECQLPITTWHIAPLESTRTMTVDGIETKLKIAIPTAPIYRYKTIAQATEGVLAKSRIADGVLVFGSFHTIGESLIALGEYVNPKQ